MKPLPVAAHMIQIKTWRNLAEPGHGVWIAAQPLLIAFASGRHSSSFIGTHQANVPQPYAHEGSSRAARRAPGAGRQPAEDCAAPGQEPAVGQAVLATRRLMRRRGCCKPIGRDAARACASSVKCVARTASMGAVCRPWVADAERVSRDGIAALKADLSAATDVTSEDAPSGALTPSAAAANARIDRVDTHGEIDPREDRRQFDKPIHVEFEGEDFQLVLSVAPGQPGHLYVRLLAGGPRRLVYASALKLRGFVER